MGFNNDLKFGQKYEKLSLEYFEYKKVDFPKGKFKPYDFILDDNIKVEVKSDRLGYKTGNIAIEYYCGDKESGITSTEANYWMYFIIYPDKVDCYKFPISDLRELIKDCRKVRGGDGWRSHMRLLPISKCSDYLTVKING
jgi:hypothetical protein